MRQQRISTTHRCILTPAVAGVPYDLNPQFMQELFTKHRIDYVLHGDDPCMLPDGTDAYEHAKKLGRFRMVRCANGRVWWEGGTADRQGRMQMLTACCGTRRLLPLLLLPLPGC